MIKSPYLANMNLRILSNEIQADVFSCFALAFSLAKRLNEDEAKKLLSGEIKYTEGMVKYAQAGSKDLIEKISVISSNKDGSENGMVESRKYRDKYKNRQTGFNDRLNQKREKLISKCQSAEL